MNSTSLLNHSKCWRWMECFRWLILLYTRSHVSTCQIIIYTDLRFSRALWSLFIKSHSLHCFSGQAQLTWGLGGGRVERAKAKPQWLCESECGFFVGGVFDELSRNNTLLCKYLYSSTVHLYSTVQYTVHTLFGELSPAGQQGTPYIYIF